MNQSLKLEPMPAWMSLLFFGVPTVIGAIGLYVLLPALARAGVPLLWNFMISVVGIFSLLLVAALAACRIEGYTMSLVDLRTRFRVNRLSRKDWLWTVGLLVVFVGGQLLLMPTAGWLISVLPFPLP